MLLNPLGIVKLIKLVRYIRDYKMFLRRACYVDKSIRGRLDWAIIPVLVDQ